MRRIPYILLLVLSAIVAGCGRSALSDVGRTMYGFQNVQDSAKTKLWWFHGETETTRNGIVADLTAFREQGVGGVVYYDQVHGKCEGALDAFSDKWWQMLKYSAHVADSLGLSFEANISNGYAAGGPWITPEYSMQRLAHVDTVVGAADKSVALPVPEQSYYKDVAVLAIPYCKERMEEWDVVEKDTVIRREDGQVFIVKDLGEERTVRSVTYQVNGRGKSRTSATNVPGRCSESFAGTGYRVLPDLGELEVSSDGKDFRKVCALKPRYTGHDTWRETTLAFAPARGRFFRISLHDWDEKGNAKDRVLKISRFRLSAVPKVDRWEEKAGLVSEYIDGNDTPYYNDAVQKESIVDVTAHVQDGVLDCSCLPEGQWMIMRFFHCSTGAKTKHGRKNLIGLECDKLSKEAARLQWDSYAQRMIDTIRSSGARIAGITMDSHEAGSQNWTEGMERHFREHAGYDIVRYLPVMAGWVVGSRDESDAFLHDLRKTIAWLNAENYYGSINSLCRENGVTFTAQAIGNALCLAGDQIMAKRHVDKPQGEFWAIHPDGNYDIKDCSSAAHVYGKQIASGEAFTDAKYSQSPAYLKQLADCAYASGINELVVCASAYQPWTGVVPGNTAGGRQYCLNRNNTYWPLSRGFWDYQSRCSYVLRQGKPVADFCVYLGDDVPVKILTYRLPDIPHGYDFDAFTTDALLNCMDANDGRIMLPDGVSYSAMVIPTRSLVTAEARSKIDLLERSGAVVIYGDAVPSDCAILKDVSIPEDRDVRFCHRRTSDADIYFVYNHDDSDFTADLLFRCKRENASIWNPMDGTVSAIARRPVGERSSVNISLSPKQSLFVVFSDGKTGEECAHAEKSDAHDIGNDWTVDFGGKTVDFGTLGDWTENDGTKHFSGTAVYRKEISIGKKRDRRYVLRLELPNSAARVYVNNREAGYIWASPFALDITGYVRKGRNELRIEVANSLVNRLIGDALKPGDARTTYSTTEIVSPGDPLVPSGIMRCWLVEESF